MAIRSYSVTTVTWLRAILADDWGVDLGRITWVTFEEPHVAEFRDPPNVERAAPGKDMVSMLLASEVAVTDSLSRSAPHLVEEVYRLLGESKRLARLPEAAALDTTPFGFGANHRNLDVAIDAVYRQGLIPRRLAVEELFDDVTRRLK